MGRLTDWLGQCFRVMSSDSPGHRTTSGAPGLSPGSGLLTSKARAFHALAPSPPLRPWPRMAMLLEHSKRTYGQYKVSDAGDSGRRTVRRRRGDTTPVSNSASPFSHALECAETLDSVSPPNVLATKAAPASPAAATDGLRIYAASKLAPCEKVAPPDTDLALEGVEEYLGEAGPPPCPVLPPVLTGSLRHGRHTVPPRGTLGSHPQ